MPALAKTTRDALCAEKPMCHLTIPDSRLSFPGFPYAANHSAIPSNSSFEICPATLILTRKRQARLSK